MLTARQKQIEQRMKALDENPNPWYKEPWPWILMSGPAIVMVACIITIYLAFTTGANEDMGGAQRRGLVIEILQERAPADAPAGTDIPAEVTGFQTQKKE